MFRSSAATDRGVGTVEGLVQLGVRVRMQVGPVSTAGQDQLEDPDSKRNRCRLGRRAEQRKRQGISFVNI
jgi:hypothetical protein